MALVTPSYTSVQVEPSLEYENRISKSPHESPDGFSETTFDQFQVKI